MPETPHSTLTAESAEELLRHVFPTASVTEVIKRTGGQLCTVFEIRCAPPTEPVIIKIYAEQWRWKQEKEIHVYRLLEQHGAGPVPRILHSQGEGSPLGQAYTIMTRIDGTPLSAVSRDLPDAEVRNIYRQLGACLASLHGITQSGFGYLTTRILDPEPTNSAYMLRQFDKKLAEFAALGGDPALHAAVESRLIEQAGLFQHCAGAVLCHNDFHEGNVLVAKGASGWRLTGFIDVENAIAADPLMDLAKTHYYAIHDDPAKGQAFHEGYGSLPSDAQDRIEIYRLYHALELWDWFASIGQTEPLPGIADDIRRMTTA
ncbi:phosphotransferase family protein [Promicromonospora sp. NPDC057138]|uniref:phosphotransferase family protein n=1 Tax=Promicromonospora sp. NPDC057138 TaxID=3346031 RepID=UPI00362DCB68